MTSTASRADSCSALASQLRSVATSPEAAQLRRQLAAIRGLERKRGCTAENSKGGFFNACGDLARQRADVQRRIEQAAGSGSGRSALQARFDTLGCAVARPRAAPKARTARQTSPGTSRGTRMLFCVRLSDGYYFPAPKSQFARQDDVRETLDQCRYICDDAGVDVYALDDASLETEEMASVGEGKAYKDLPAAFRYRDNANFQACDLKRYYDRVNELRARTVTPGNLANAIIPLPAAKPQPAVAADMGIDPETQSSIDGAVSPAAAPSGAARPLADRPVRIVGPAFFPED